MANNNAELRLWAKLLIEEVMGLEAAPFHPQRAVDKLGIHELLWIRKQQLIKKHERYHATHPGSQCKKWRYKNEEC